MKQNADDANPVENGTLIIADLINPFKSAMEHPRDLRSILRLMLLSGYNYECGDSGCD